MKSLSLLDAAQITAGLVYQNHADLFIMAPGDTLHLPSFVIEYPQTGGPSNAYILNGNPVHCSSNKEDNVWTVPSAISNSVCSKDSVTVQTDGLYLYVQANYSSVFEQPAV